MVEPLESRIAPALATTIPVGSLNGGNGFSILGKGQVGNDVSIVGDVNGDGYDDALVSDFTTPSAAYIVFGKPSGFSATIDLKTLPAANGFSIVKPSAKDASNFALTLGGVGDLNGDGFADFAVGSAAEDVGASKVVGAVYVVFGKSSFGSNVNLDLLTGADGFKLTGAAALDFFGTSIASAGDVNSDGFGDLVVTASSAGGRAGAAYVVFGKAAGFAPVMSVASLSGSNGFTIAGEKANDFLGSAGSAGDVNGDGFGDLILGASGSDAKGTYSGSAYVVFGHAGPFAPILKTALLSGGAGFKIRGAAAGDRVGFSVSSAGDFNGDGFADVLVGALVKGVGAVQYAGAAYLVFGQASFATELNLSSLTGGNGFKLVDSFDHAAVGYAVGAAGDVNGDGFDDAVVSSNHLGGAYVIYGKAGGFAAQTDLTTLQQGEGFKISGTRAYRVSGAGDMNGDGLDDVLIGARDLSRAHLVFGFDSGAITHPGGSGADTLTGDGNANVIVGGQGTDTLLGKGGADAMRGGQGSDILTVTDLNFARLHGGTGLDTLRLDGAGLALDLTHFGGTLRPDPRLHGLEQIDLTGSGNNTLTLTVRDVVNLSPTSNTLTVYGNAGDTVNFGGGWILFGEETIGTVVVEVFTQGAATLKVAAAVTTPLPIGYHPHALDGQHGSTVTGAGFSQFARSLTSAGDVNGDGFDDLIGGDYQASFSGGAGAAYVVFGKAAGLPASLSVNALDGTNGFRITGTAGVLTSFGAAVSAAGDVNGDGFADVIVGAFNESPNASKSGAAYVIFGQSSGFGASVSVTELNNAGKPRGFKMSGSSYRDNVGATVGGAGDVNGDGFDDVIVGAVGLDAGVSNTGAAYVVFGKLGPFPPNLQIASLTGPDGFRISGVEKGAYLGGSVNSAGDLNGDGFADIVVGASGSRVSGAYSGAAYVVFGKAIFTADVKAGTGGFRIKGAAAGDRLGQSAGSAGDVNGDGFGDLIIGAFAANASGVDSGAAYVIFGKTASFGTDFSLASLKGPTGFRLLGAKPGDLAGYSASAAGDVNGDGYDDVIVGANGGIFSTAEFGDSFVVYGKASFTGDFNLGSVDGATGFKLGRAKAGDGSASAVSNAGDVNGDGFDDVLVGAPFATPSAAYVLYGFDSGAVTQLRGSGNDTLTGTAAARDVIVTGQGNDTLLTVGFGDALRGGQGNDTFSITTGPLQRLDGGHGSDTLVLNGNLLFDLTARSTYRIRSFEEVDLRPGVNYLSLNAHGVVNASPDTNTLIVHADATDVVNIGLGWTATGSETINGENFTVLRQGAAVLKLSTVVASLIAPIVTLVNATTATYRDVDGDLVTIKTTKGTLGVSDFFLLPAGTVGGAQLAAANFGDDGAEFLGSDLTITAQRTAIGGDGRVNVGRIDATGVDFGKITIAGDLGRLDAGDAILTTMGVKALSVGSIGVFGATTQAAGGLLRINVQGELGALTVASDFLNATLSANVPATAIGIGSMTIGGSIIADGAGVNFSTPGSVGAIKIGGDVRGGPSAAAVILSFDIGVNIASFTVGGSLAAGVNTAIGAVNAGGAFGPITIGGDFDHTKISAVKSFASLTVGGSVLSSRVLGGFDLFEVPRNADVTIGAVKVVGDWVASILTAGVVNSVASLGKGGDVLLASGSPAVAGGDPTKIARVASIAITGEVVGTPASVNGADFFGFVAEEIGTFTVGGTKLPLTAGKSNDSAGVPVGATDDVKVREVNTTVSAVDPTPALPGFNLGTLNGANGFRFDGTDGATAGGSVAGLGDVNGDGIDDLIIGARGGKVGGQVVGEAYVIFGTRQGFDPTLQPADLNGRNGFRILRGTPGAQLGVAVGAAGDVNGDGLADVIVGQIDFRPTESQTSAYVIFGKATPFAATVNVSALNGMDGFELRPALTAQNGGGFRMGVSGAGDLNDDGRDDVIVGVYNSNLNGQFSGSDYVFFSPTSGSPALLNGAALNGSNGFRFDGASTNAQVGYSVSEAGDLNGDGVDDIVLGAPDETVTQTKQGAAYMIYGKKSGAPAFPSVLNPASVMAGNGALGFRITGTGLFSVTGASVDSAGDVNGDGFDDLVVGAPYADIHGNYSGASYVIYGKMGNFGSELALAGLTASQGFRISGESDYDYTGRVAGVRDVNGDGFDDLLVGGIGLGPGREFRGGAYLVYGRATGAADINVNTAVRLNGVSFDDETGGAVSGGDLNGDGRPDLIIGADSADNGGNFAGSTYVVFNTDVLTLSNGGKTAAFTDVDGDLVTVKTTAGQFLKSDFTLVRAGNVGGVQLQKLNLSGAAHNAFNGASLTFTATRSSFGGDGFVNVGALLGTGHDLGAVSIDGDLGRLEAGNGDTARSALTSLTVHSLGRFDLSTQAAAGASLESDIRGKLGTLTVRSDIVGAFINIDGSTIDGDDDAGAITIGGSIRSSALAKSGTIFAGGDLGLVKVGGSIIGSAASHTGSLEALGSIAGVTVGHSLVGGTGIASGSIIAGPTLGAVSIGGNFNGGHIFVNGRTMPGSAALALAIKSVSVAGSVLRADIFAGYDRTGAPKNADVQIGAVTVGRDWTASDLVAGMRPIDAYYGNGDETIPGGDGDVTVSKIASILIKGQVLGTPFTAGDHFGFVAQEIGAFTIGATKFPLTAGRSNDLAGLPAGATGDVRVREGA